MAQAFKGVEGITDEGGVVICLYPLALDLVTLVTLNFTVVGVIKASLQVLPRILVKSPRQFRQHAHRILMIPLRVKAANTKRRGKEIE